ncbi:hypothetical protein GCM10028773_23920 [Spirosoma koreense]
MNTVVFTLVGLQGRVNIKTVQEKVWIRPSLVVNTLIVNCLFVTLFDFRSSMKTFDVNLDTMRNILISVNDNQSTTRSKEAG